MIFHVCFVSVKFIVTEFSNISSMRRDSCLRINQSNELTLRYIIFSFFLKWSVVYIPQDFSIGLQNNDCVVFLSKPLPKRTLLLGRKRTKVSLKYLINFSHLVSFKILMSINNLAAEKSIVFDGMRRYCVFWWWWYI